MNNFLRVGFLPYFITAKLTKNSVVNKTALFLFILLGQLLYHCPFLFHSINHTLSHQFIGFASLAVCDSNKYVGAVWGWDG